MKHALKNKLNVVYMCALSLATSACTSTLMSEQDLLNLAPDQAVTITGYETSMDGKRMNQGLSHCTLYPAQIDEEASTGERDKYKRIKLKFIEDPELPGKDYVVALTDAGEVQLTQLYCMSYKVFYNKTRLIKLDPPVKLTAKAGKINYAGDLYFDLTTDSFKLGDLFYSGTAAGWTHDDKSSTTVKYKSDIDSAINALATKFPEGVEAVPSVKSPIKKHPNIIGN